MRQWLPGVKVPTVRGRHGSCRGEAGGEEATAVEQELPATFKHLMVAAEAGCGCAVCPGEGPPCFPWLG